MTRRSIVGILSALVAISAAASLFYFRAPDDQNPNRQSRIALRLASFNLSLDPANILDTESRRVIDMTHAKLIDVDASGRFSPEIAEAWTWDDPHSLRVTLRPGLVFSNGAPIRAQDAAWSLCRNLQPSAPFRWLFDNIVSEPDGDDAVRCTGLMATDERTLRISIKHSPDRLIRALSSSMGAVIPEGSQPGKYSSLPGAGPYQLGKIDANSQVELVAKQGGPIDAGVERVVFRQVVDDAAAVAQFAKGELDVLEVGNPRLLAMVKSANTDLKFRTTWTDVHQIRFVIVNRDRLKQKFGWADDRVMAFMGRLASSIDQTRLVLAYGELGKPLSTAYFPARGSVAPRQTTGERLDAARGELFLIAENDAYSDLIASLVPTSIDGIVITRQGLDKGLLIDRLIKKDYDLACISLEALVDDSVYWMSFFRPGSAFTIFGSPLALLENKEPADFDPVDLAAIIDREGNWLPLFQERRAYLFSPGVEGERLLPTGLIDYSRLRRTK